MKLLHQFAFLMLINILSLQTIEAKDFGIMGHVFEIAEEDVMSVIERRLKEVDLVKFNKEARERTEKLVKRPPSVKGIDFENKEPRIFYFDPSFTVFETIYDDRGEVIQPKGKKINPLKQISLSSALVFIDGDNKAQVKDALLKYKMKNKNLKIILVKGSPLEVTKLNKIWIFFDQLGELTSKFGIKAVPALITQVGMRLKIEEYVLKDQSSKDKSLQNKGA